MALSLKTTVLKAGAELTEVAVKTLNGPILASPGVWGCSGFCSRINASVVRGIDLQPERRHSPILTAMLQESTVPTSGNDWKGNPRRGDCIGVEPQVLTRYGGSQQDQLSLFVRTINNASRCEVCLRGQ
jgi:hypothetical protein